MKTINNICRAGGAVLAAAALCAALTGCSETQPVEINETNFPNADVRAYVAAAYDADGDGYLSAYEIYSMRTSEGYWKAVTELPSMNELAERLYDKQHPGVEISTANFPDENFRSYVAASFDTDGDGKLSRAEINSVTQIDCQNRGIKDLTGIAYFTNLEKLDCAHNSLANLDVSQNTSLTYLSCDYNDLTALDVSHNKQLVSLYCTGNKLTALDLSQNAKLEQLGCMDNKLTSLDLSHNPELTSIACYWNNIDTLDISANTKLAVLYWQVDKTTTVTKNGKVYLDKR